MAKINDISNLSYDQLIELMSWGICSKKPEGRGPMDAAFNGGKYLGGPGKDIYFFLPKATEEQLSSLSKKVVEMFPTVAPGNHVGPAACIRYIYGQFERKGILRSNEDFERMRNEDLDSNWRLPRHFMQMVENEFVAINHNYGLCIHFEMKAHRIGDEAVINKDQVKLDEMESTYLKSVHYAYECSSFKQMFSPYYWASRYFMKFGDKKKALEFSYICIKQAEKHCPDARGTYVKRLVDCITYIKKYDPKNWKSFNSTYKNNAKNLCVQKAFAKKIK
jgi:hypothetical protein